MSKVGFEPTTQETSTLCSNLWATQTKYYKKKIR